MYQPIEKWIPLDRDASPTTASTNLYNALVAAGAKPVNLGQGREIVELPLLQKLTIEAFEQAIKGGRLINSKYGSPSAELNAASAAWLKRIMNVDTTKDTTFTIENQGRGGLYAAFHLLASQAGFRKDGRVVVPDTSWPMVTDQLNDFQLKPAIYTMARGRYADNIRAQLAAHGDAVVGVYVNSPHNPTGTLLTKADFEQIFAVLNAANSGAALERRGGRKIGLVMDNPYPHAAPEIVRDRPARSRYRPRRLPSGSADALDHAGQRVEILRHRRARFHHDRDPRRLRQAAGGAVDAFGRHRLLLTLFPRADGYLAERKRRDRARSFRKAAREIHRQPLGAESRARHRHCRWRSRHAAPSGWRCISRAALRNDRARSRRFRSAR